MWRKKSNNARINWDIHGKINVMLGNYYIRENNEKCGKSKNQLSKKLHGKSGIYEITCAKIHEKRGKPRIHVGKSTGCYQG